jgi:hypothetical protein
MSLFPHIRSTSILGGAVDATRAAGEALNAQQRVAELEEQLDKLTLVCAAMWNLLKEKTALTEDDLAARVAIIDARDGAADGKMTHTVRPCAKCHRPVAARHRKCLYCGFEQPVTTIFETL